MKQRNNTLAVISNLAHAFRLLKKKIGAIDAKNQKKNTIPVSIEASYSLIKLFEMLFRSILHKNQYI